MAKLTDTFNSKNFSYHMKQGGRHDFYAVWEFLYNALPFIFPKNESTTIHVTRSGYSNAESVYSLNGTRLAQAHRGINIINGKKVIR